MPKSKSRLKYLGTIKVKKAYGGWIKGITDPKTIGIRIDRDNVAEFVKNGVEYLKQNHDSPLVLTVFRKQEDEHGFRTTMTVNI